MHTSLFLIIILCYNIVIINKYNDMGDVYKMIPVLSEVKDIIDREKVKRTIESGKKKLTYSDLLLEKFKK